MHSTLRILSIDILLVLRFYYRHLPCRSQLSSRMNYEGTLSLLPARLVPLGSLGWGAFFHAFQRPLWIKMNSWYKYLVYS